MTKTVLVVASHADDEVLGCGGTIARHVAQGDEVYVTTMTLGARSMSDFSFDTRGFMARAAGLEGASEALGFHIVGGGGFEPISLDVANKVHVHKFLSIVREQVMPDIVYTQFWGDINPDHVSTAHAVLTVFRPIPHEPCTEIRCFEVLSSTEWSFGARDPFLPNLYVDVSEFMDLKIKAMNCYNDELRKYPHPRSNEAIIAKSRVRGSEVGVSAAEAFVVPRRLILTKESV